MPVFVFDGEFLSNKELWSKSISLNDGVIRAATLMVTPSCMSNTADFTFYMSNNGGTTWELVTANTRHVFSTSGQDLRYRVLGNTGATLNLKPGDGFTYPIYAIIEF